ncbi:MFS transporter [Rhodobacteraceae bacterium]|nr:MFS transporter [Paracoccaceae bacterium]
MLLVRNRNYRMFFSAAGISNLGDGISALAFPWLATLITRDPFLIGLVAAAGRLPWLLFALPAGVITDRVNRQSLMVRADLFRLALTFGVVAMVLSAPPLPLADQASTALSMIVGLAAAAFLLGTAEVFRDNAAQTAMPQVVDKADLEAANGQLWSIEQIMGQFIGPPLAGLLIAFAIPLPFLFDAATFGVAALLIWLVTMRDVPLAPKTTSFRAQFMEGAVWMRGHKVILTFAIMLSVLNFVTFGVLATLVLFSQDVLGLTATGHGLLLSAGALGAVIGGLTGPALVKAIGARRVIVTSLAIFFPAFLVIGLSSHPVVAAAAIASLWGAGMIWNVVTVSLRQRVIPPELLGRVNSIYRFFGWGSIPLGALTMGAIVAIFEPTFGRDTALRLPFFIASGITVLLLLYAMLKVRLDD